MIFEHVASGGDRNLSYLAGDERSRRAAVIDPGFAPQKLLQRARELSLQITWIINTHAHFDHSYGNEHIIKATGARLVGYSLKEPALGVMDGDELCLGSHTARILHTPGHTSDSICVLVQNRLFTGDTLFVGMVGGTGYGRDARQQYDSLHTKVMKLPDEVEVYPGHDYGAAPMSTIGHEKKTNPFILADSFEAFLALKQNWAAYKRKHGIE